MGLALAEPAEPIDLLADAKAWCRVDDDSTDAEITALIASSVGLVEAYTGRSLGAQDWLLTLDDFCDEIELPRGPVSAVAADGVKYFDVDEAEQTLDPSVYQLDLVNNPQRIVRDPDHVWPAVGDVVNAVQITFTTGYEDLPAPIHTAVLSLVAHWFDNRVAGDMPDGVKRLLSPFRAIVI